MQSRGDGVKRGRNNQFPANIKTLAGQHPLLGTLMYLIKAAPTAVLRRNIFLRTYTDGNIIVPDDLGKVVEELNNVFQLAPTYDEEEGLIELLDNMTTIE